MSLHAICFIMVGRLAHSSNLKMGATCFSETSVDFQRTTRRHIPEEKTLYLLSFTEEPSNVRIQSHLNPIPIHMAVS
jgi:hypothetical protein